MHKSLQHRLNMEFDLQSLLGSMSPDVQSFIHWLRPPIPPYLDSYIRGRYWSVWIDDISFNALLCSINNCSFPEYCCTWVCTNVPIPNEKKYIFCFVF
jgi:hypothetical protein